ncbi:Chaperone required for the assembly of the F1-ATPase [Yoonia tamlensis]|uniref:Chaperone required for the assembly of the F1-ATPase n=1 Tax=Yoonia tamlensis TaxID=390270 RepID=A0A1I6FNG3_9RHOB|nr:ATP12 family protein [Yoonia tamlensis]SFR31448.1 Chaperone required for the assembly of the F1-ATPase [Yoonia tamlensis]
MSDWKPKRFWKTATATTCEGGFTVELDSRSVKTPAKATLIVPTMPMAEAIAAEWDAQGETLDPATMPITRGANAAIDKVRTQHAEVAEMLAEYGDSDLLCYRAAGPDMLIARQAAAWDPMLEWAAATLGARLAVGQGVMHVAQDPDALAVLRAEVCAFDEFALAAAHDLISISGSLILGLAVVRGKVEPDTAWLVSRVDEHWQIEQWGADEEAADNEAIKRTAFLDAARFYKLSRS